MRKGTIISFLICLIIIPSCAEDSLIPEDKEDEKLEAILGDWKLLELVYWVFGNDSSGMKEFNLDYSAYDITYSFLPDSVLKIDAGTHPTWDDSINQYEFGYFPLGGSNDPEILLLKINGRKFTYSYDGNTMVIGQSYVDGADLHFKKK